MRSLRPSSFPVQAGGQTSTNHPLAREEGEAHGILPVRGSTAEVTTPRGRTRITETAVITPRLTNAVIGSATPRSGCCLPCHHSKIKVPNRQFLTFRRHTARDEGSSKSDRKAQKRCRSQSPSVSRSRSRSRSPSIHSEVRPLSPASSVKRRRKASASPEARPSERKSSRRTKKDRAGGSSPSRVEDEVEEARGRKAASRSRSRRRNDSRSRSVDSKAGVQKQGSTGTAGSTATRKERLPKSPSRSRSPSRSPSSSPQAALKTNGSSKHVSNALRMLTRRKRGCDLADDYFIPLTSVCLHRAREPPISCM